MTEKERPGAISSNRGINDGVYKDNTYYPKIQTISGEKLFEPQRICDILDDMPIIEQLKKRRGK